jgi:hypothetical protein
MNRVRPYYSLDGGQRECPEKLEKILPRCYNHNEREIMRETADAHL